MHTAMNAIMGFTGLLNKTGITLEEQEEYSGIITDGCTRLMEMMDNVLEISLLQSGCDDFVSKPIDPAAINKVLYRFLN